MKDEICNTRTITLMTINGITNVLCGGTVL